MIAWPLRQTIPRISWLTGCPRRRERWRPTWRDVVGQHPTLVDDRSADADASTTAGSWVATTTTAPRAASLAQLGHHVLAVALVELARGLVGEQHLGPDHECARTRDPLHLAAGQLLDLTVAEVADVEAVQRVGRAGSSTSATGTPRARSAIATFSRAREDGDQAVDLQHERDLGARVAVALPGRPAVVLRDALASARADRRRPTAGTSCRSRTDPTPR